MGALLKSSIVTDLRLLRIWKNVFQLVAKSLAVARILFQKNDIVFELHMYDPNDVLQWGMYGGLVTYEPYHEPYD